MTTRNASLRTVAGRALYRRGTDWIALDDLVSPLRYDILIRAQYFAFLAERFEQYERDFRGFLAAASEHVYFTWFEHVALARYRPETTRQPELIRQAFELRVRKSGELYRRFQARGFDAAHPVSLRTATPGATSPTGKTVARTYYAGDGCHRLALLLMSGQRELPPSYYRVRRRPLGALLDNTSTLLRVLDLAPEQYYAFLSRGYAEQVFCDRDGLLAHVASRRPERLAELRNVIAADSALVGSPGA